MTIILCAPQQHRGKRRIPILIFNIIGSPHGIVFRTDDTHSIVNDDGVFGTVIEYP
jgi:hypothetical protein